MLFLTLCALLLLFAVSERNAISVVDNNILNVDQRTLTWLPSSAGGLFSHFFQVRYINSIAQKFNRTLVIAPHTSIHATDDKNVIMCDVLKLENMVCISHAVSNKKKCAQDLELDAFRNMTHACFGGHNIWGAISLFEVMKLGPSLAFQPRFRDMYALVRDSFLRNLTATYGADASFMVVHWRRGDQLTTRCLPDWKGYKDRSINCQSAAALVNDVQRLVRSHNATGAFNLSAILVATNEQNGTTLDYLRAHGLQPMTDMFKQHYVSAADTAAAATEPPSAQQTHVTVHSQSNTSSANRSHAPQAAAAIASTVSIAPSSVSSLDEFVVEAQFMLDAPLFLSYGISQINDVVESERSKQGRAACLRAEELDHKSWCEGMRLGRHLPKEERNAVQQQQHPQLQSQQKQQAPQQPSVPKPKPPAAQQPKASNVPPAKGSQQNQQSQSKQSAALSTTKKQLQSSQAKVAASPQPYKKAPSSAARQELEVVKEDKSAADKNSSSSDGKALSQRQQAQLLQEQLKSRPELSTKEKEALMLQLRDQLRKERERTGSKKSPLSSTSQVQRPRVEQLEEDTDKGGRS